MSKLEMSFGTEAEAEAFQEGIEWGKDLSISVKGIHYKSGSWVVEMDDEDEADEAEDD